MTKISSSRKKKSALSCDACKRKPCAEGEDCFGMSDQILLRYTQDNLTLARAASKIEGQYYMKKTRLEEIILFAREMGLRRLGIAFCIGLSEEAKILADILRKYFDVVSVCCKVCGIRKNQLDLEKIHPDQEEVMCNPIGQVVLLNQAETDLNIIVGLYIGHDIQFTNHSEAPVTTFIVKDRILAHNTVASLTCRYLRKRIDNEIWIQH